MTTEWGALSGLFPMDDVLRGWLRSKATMAAIDKSAGRSTNDRFTHEALDHLFANQLSADRGAKYAKTLHMDLSTLSPYVSGPNSVKVATPLNDLESQSIKADKAYLLSWTKSRASDIAAAAKVFKDAAVANDGEIPSIADGVKFYIAAASSLEQQAAGPIDTMAKVCMENYDPDFASLSLRKVTYWSPVFNFGCGSSREQAATAILAKRVPLVAAGSFGNIFSRNSINNALMCLELPNLVRRLRETFSERSPPPRNEEIFEPEQNRQSLDSPPPAPAHPQAKVLTRRTGWKLLWDVKKSQIEIEEGEGGKGWSEKGGELPPIVQEIIAKGGLEQ